jgi:hypothetical protein
MRRLIEWFKIWRFRRHERGREYRRILRALRQ